MGRQRKETALLPELHFALYTVLLEREIKRLNEALGKRREPKEETQLVVAVVTQHDKAS